MAYLSKKFHNPIKIYHSKKSIVFRAQLEKRNVVVKVLPHDYPYKKGLADFSKEKYIGHLLDNVDNVVKIISLEQQNNNALLIYDDFGGEPLKALIHKFKDNWEFFFKVAINTINALGEIHEKDIVHKDIKPSNIIVHPKTFQVKITDLGLASHLPNGQKEYARKIKGSPAYISPEQTGTINRLIDNRSDFYSYGVTLYEMIVGEPPFLYQNISELLYSHVARSPSLVSHSGRIPEILRLIIQKLLQKSPDERYQTAQSISFDIQKCWNYWKKKQRFESFQLGQQNQNNRLQISTKLCQRNDELSILNKLFERVIRYQNLQLISFEAKSGMGKTYTILEWQANTLERNYYFAHGELISTEERPYSILSKMAETLINRILLCDQSEIDTWKKNFESIDHLGALTDFVPNLDRLLRQPIKKTNLYEYNLKIIWMDFLAIFTSNKPLILFFDNWHFVGEETLEWLNIFLKEMANHPIFIVITISNHEKLDIRNIDTKHIQLKPLSINSVKQILQQTLYRKKEELNALAALILKKTDGSPHAICDFLRLIYKKNLLQYKNKIWSFDLQNIALVESESVAIIWRNSSPDLQNLISVSSCMKRKFSIELIADILQKPFKNVEKISVTAVKRNIIQQHQSGYLFSNHKLQDFVYDLLDSDRKKEYHYQIAMFYNKERFDLFECVYHLNRSYDEEFSKQHRDLLIELNLKVGKKFKWANNYEQAINYFEKVYSYLKNEENWEKHYHLCFDLYLQIFECEYLRGNNDIAISYLNSLEKYANNDDLFHVYHLYCRLLTIRERYSDCVNIATKSLQMNNEKINASPSVFRVLFEFLIVSKRLLTQKNITLQNKEIENCLSIYSNIVVTSSFISPKLFFFILLRQLSLSLKHGESQYTSLAYIYYAWLQKAMRRSDKIVKSTSDRAMTYCKNLPNTPVKCRTELQNLIVISHWYSPLKKLFPQYLRIYKNSYLVGDFMSASFCCIHYIEALLAHGTNLENVEQNIDKFFTRENKLIYISLSLFSQFILCLKRKTKSYQEWDDNNFSTKDFLKEIEDDRGNMGTFYHLKIQSLYILGYEEQARSLLPALFKNMPIQAILATNVVFTWNILVYYFLLLSGNCDNKSSPQYKKYKKRLHQQKKLWRKWSKECEENFLHIYQLVCAEFSRINGNYTQALALYEKAILNAQKYDFLQHEAIICERAAKLCRSYVNKKIEKVYIKQAHECYQKWGALAKVKILEEKHNWLIQTNLEPNINNSLVDISETITSEKLDIKAVLQNNQYLSMEIELIPLLKKWLNLAMQSSGAQKGAVLIQDEHLIVTAIKNITEKDEVELLFVPIENYANLPHKIIRYVTQIQKMIIEPYAFRNKIFNVDSYIQKEHLKSVVCLPLQMQDRFIGILYLENNSMTHAFAHSKIEILQILSTQASIAIKNSQLYEKLQNEIKERVVLEKRILQIGDGEKQRIGRDLHDGLGQYFAAIQMTNSAIRRSLQKSGLSGEVEKIDEMAEFIKECTGSVRKISQGLSLIHLEGKELRYALEEITQNTITMYSVSCTLKYHSEMQIANLEITTHIYRIVQEAIQNAIRHGKADNIQILLEENIDDIIITICDNGTSIPKNFITGLGMFTMVSRAELMGGKLTVTPNQNGGTEVKFNVKRVIH